MPTANIIIMVIRQGTGQVLRYRFFLNEAQLLANVLPKESPYIPPLRYRPTSSLHTHQPNSIGTRLDLDMVLNYYFSVVLPNRSFYNKYLLFLLQ